MRAFEIGAELPGVGVTVLEASAGTGKTHTVAALATRFVAEGLVSLDELLVITFSRAATQELRDRVRDQFVETADALEAALQGTAPAGSATGSSAGSLAEVLTRGCDTAEVEQRLARLQHAVADYDAATIATTHEFCSIVLRSLGVAGDTDSTDRLHEDISDLVDEVVDDRYLVHFADAADEPPIDHHEARRAARAAMDNVHARIEPGDDAESPRARALGAFARDVRDEVARRKRAGNIITFDDLLSRLADAVAQVPSPAAERMRSRWRVVLVDEFQDTDPVQWQLLEGAFAESSRLVLIGDPKQAIYAFRGGDTPTYLRAVTGADQQTLTTNWRSDEVVVEALQAFIGGAALGDEKITVHEVRAEHDGSSLSGVDGGVRLRQVRRDGFRLNKNGTISIGKVKAHVAADLAADIAALLSSGATYRGEKLGPGDIAILLSSVKKDGPAITDELRRRGIPYVINTAQSVMTGEAAQHWSTLLAAFEQPHRAGRVRAAALTPFLGRTAADLDAGGDDLTDALAERVRSWLDLLRSRGVAAVLGAAHSAGLAARVLAQPGGERLLTDLNHIGQVLQAAAQEQRLGVAGLVAWLREAIEEGNRNDARRRRLDIDAEAVQLVTIHGSKGLEYPVVYLPQLYDLRLVDWVTTHAYHGPDGQRCLDVADSPAAKEAARREDAEEELRLAYVALTRATAQVVCWWAPTWDGPQGALTRLLFGRRRGEAAVAARAEFPETDEGVDEVLRGWSEAGAFRWEPSVVAEAVPPLPAGDGAQLRARVFAREVDTEWRRTSYSGLIRSEEQVAGTALDVSEPEEEGTTDEDLPDDETAELVTEADPDALVSPMAQLRGGAAFGSLVHAVLEHADPRAADLRAELLTHIEEQRRWWSVEATSEELADAMVPMHDTPLGPLAGDLTLRQIAPTDRLCELDFELPMAGGDLAHDLDLPLSEFGAALRRHLPEGDPMRAYADRLDNPSLGDQRLRGYLSGSIDVVLRVPDGEGPGNGPTNGHRFVVVDYKTNQLGDPARPPTAWDYRPEALTAAMLHSHYPLQSLLYSVVVHRYLRWRLRGYDPEQHLGGILYLYVRGMCGPETPTVDGVPCGVFSWRPPVALVEDLSAILDGRRIDTRLEAAR